MDSQLHDNQAIDNSLEESITYNVDKMTFIVTPVYRKDPGNTIHELLLNLMKKPSETH